MNKFYTNCSYCQGLCRVDNTHSPINEDGEHSENFECGECDGLGINYTEEGTELLQFLAKAKII